MNLIESWEKRFPNLDIVFAYFAGGESLGHGLKPVKSAQSTVKHRIFSRMRAVCASMAVNQACAPAGVHGAGLFLENTGGEWPNKCQRRVCIWQFW
jgi:hypothetical protein